MLNTTFFAICGGIMCISSGTRHSDRARIGARVREIRENKGLEARDLARLAGIDAADNGILLMIGGEQAIPSVR